MVTKTEGRESLFTYDPTAPSALILSKLSELKEVTREGWRVRGVRKVDREDDTEHSVRVHDVCFRLRASCLRRGYRLQTPVLGVMSLIHDFDEKIIKDELERPPFYELAGEDVKVRRIIGMIDPKAGLSIETKRDRAIKLMAFETLLENSHWPTDVKLTTSRVYSDYIFGYSPEAKAVHQAHPIANLERGLDYMAGRATRSGESYPKIDLTTFWDDVHMAMMMPDGPFDLAPEVQRLKELEREIKGE